MEYFKENSSNLEKDHLYPQTKWEKIRLFKCFLNYFKTWILILEIGNPEEPHISYVVLYLVFWKAFFKEMSLFCLKTVAQIVEMKGEKALIS